MGKISASDVIKKARSNKSLKAVGSPVNSDLPAAKLHSGKSTVGKEQIRRFALLEVDPSVCTPWKYHNRDSAWLNETKCSDLIYSIKNNGQLEPALVREISDCKKV